jgi:two-component system cell cycle sensor histidine kinase PleC
MIEKTGENQGLSTGARRAPGGGVADIPVPPLDFSAASPARQIRASTSFDDEEGIAARLGASGFAGWCFANLITAALYCTLGYAVGEFFARYGLFPAPIWLPSSVAVVAALIGGLRMFPGIFLGSLIVNYVLFSPPFWEAVLISLINGLGPIAGAMLGQRFRPKNGYFNRFTGVVVFIVANILIHPALTAGGGTAALSLFSTLDGPALWATWVGWWLSDSGGTLFCAPALLLWIGNEREALPRPKDVDRSDVVVWWGVAAAVIMLFMTLPLQGSIRWALPFLLVLPLSWISLRMSLRAAYSLVSLVAVVAAAGTVAGFGPFQGQGVANPLQLVGVLVVLLSLNVLAIVSLVAELRDAEEISRRKSLAVASTTHDLKTPLTAILGFSDLVRNEVLGPLGNPSYRECMERIHANGSLLLDIINDNLDLSKIEAGRRDITPVPLDAKAVAEACLAIVAPKAAAKILSTAIEAPKPVSVYADPTALRQILLNLLANAIAYTPVGGRITIRLAEEDDGAAALEVIDTGAGMDEEGVKLALQPYGQLRSKPGRATEDGSGLGLPISAQLTELHGGKLSIVSTPCKGTTVRATFPPARVASDYSNRMFFVKS